MLRMYSFKIEVLRRSLIWTLVVVSPFATGLDLLTNYPFVLLATKFDMSLKGPAMTSF